LALPDASSGPFHSRVTDIRPWLPAILKGATYCHPEAYDGVYEDLSARVRSAAPDDEEIRVFRIELREALADPGQLPDNELFKAVQFSDGSNEAFLRRLWRDLYGGEP
jgi:hypothetical protein